MPRRKCNELDVSAKLYLLAHYKALPKCSQRSAAEQLSISHGCLTNLLEHKEDLQTDAALEQGQDRKRQQHGKDKDVEEGLWKWFLYAQSRKVPVNGLILLQKANDITQRLGHQEFKCSDGWLQRWKRGTNCVKQSCKVKGVKQTSELWSLGTKVRCRAC